MASQLGAEGLEARRPGGLVLEQLPLCISPDETRLVHDEVRVVELVQAVLDEAIHVLASCGLADRVAGSALDRKVARCVWPLIPLKQHTWLGSDYSITAVIRSD